MYIQIKSYKKKILKHEGSNFFKTKINLKLQNPYLVNNFLCFKFQEILLILKFPLDFLNVKFKIHFYN